MYAVEVNTSSTSDSSSNASFHLNQTSFKTITTPIRNAIENFDCSNSRQVMLNGEEIQGSGLTITLNQY